MCHLLYTIICCIGLFYDEGSSLHGSACRLYGYVSNLVQLAILLETAQIEEKCGQDKPVKV